MKNHLHIGVLRGGKLVDERYVPEKGEVSVGSAAKNMFALLGSNLPEKHVLFSFKAKQPTIHLGPGMGGEIAIDGKSPATLDSLQAKGRKQGDGWEMDLPLSARGWVGVGDAAFFFNIAPKPPPPPKSSLPAGVSTSFLSGLEKTFTAALVAIVMLEAGGVAFVRGQPEIDPDKPAEEDLDRFAEIIMPDKPVEEPKKEEDDKKKADDEAAKKKAEEEAKKKAEEEAKKKAEEKKAEADPATQAKAADEKKKAVDNAVKNSALFVALGSVGSGGGALANVFANTGFGDDVDKAFAGAGGVKIATGDDAGQRKGAAGGGGPVGIGDLGAAAGGGGGGAAVALKEKPKVAAPQIAFDDSEFETESSSVDKGQLGKYIKARIKSVQGCYEKELKLNPALKGKIVVRFVITTQGRVGEVSIESNSMGNENVAACIRNLVKNWTFPIKPEEDTPASFPFVFSPGG